MGKFSWFALERRGDHLTRAGRTAALPFVCRIRAEVCYTNYGFKVLRPLDSPLLDLRVNFIILISLQGDNICDCMDLSSRVAFFPP